MLRTTLCDYSDTYMLVKETTTAENISAVDTGANNSYKKVIR